MKLALAFLVACCAVLLAACGENMRDNSRLQPYEPSTFYPDGQSERQVISGTVALGMLHADDPVYTGKVGDQLATTFPFTITRAVLARGQERFNIYCAPCHGFDGDGDGMVVRRGFPAPPSYHSAALMKAPSSHFIDVITNGYGVMYSYADQVAPADRWAIVAYIRELQKNPPQGVDTNPTVQPTLDPNATPTATAQAGATPQAATPTPTP